MFVEVQRWGNSGAVRLPAATLKALGVGVGGRFVVHVEGGKLVLEPEQAPSLEQLLAGISPENRHALLLEGKSRGAEIW